MNYDLLLALDPSGNFREGKGTTGFCILDCSTGKVKETGTISAKDFPSMEAYWDAHIRLLTHFARRHGKKAVVIEDYLLYGDKAATQVHSRMETPKVIGLMQWFLWKNKMDYFMQLAADVKRRWSNDILVHAKALIQRDSDYYLPRHKSPICRHEIDSIRHAIHFYTFKVKE